VNVAIIFPSLYGVSLAYRHLISLATGALVVLGLLVAVPSSPATAASTTLCSGWSGCVSAGYSDAGYGAANRSSFWRMYSGHNCTNYVAYRMVGAGMSSERPFSGTGNAWNWGVQMASKTNQTPSVGAIAWFNKSAGGAGSAGHVAYVEQVVSPTEIIVSEDSWSGDFHWRRITAGSSWPSGFIHLTDNAIANTSPVTVTGTPAVGSTVGSTPGGWAPAAGYSYQWLLDGQAVAGATAPSLALTSAHGGKSLVLRVTAALSGYTSTIADSAPVTVGLGALSPSATPQVTGAAGRAMVGATLRTTQPTFAPAPRAVGVQWLADGTPIAGATGTSYQLTSNEVGRSVTAQVTGRRPGYAATPVTGNAVGPVLAGVVDVSSPFAVVGRTRVGRTLRVTPGTTAPSDAVASYTWLRNGGAIAGATGASYVLTEADAGKSVAVSINVDKVGYAGRTRKVSAGSKVASAPTFVLKTVGRRSAARVWFRVSAPGTATPDGTAVVRVGPTTRTVPVRAGVGRLAVRGLAAGRQPVTIAWRGNESVMPGRTAGKVRVKG
jgi:surface antigen